MYQDLGFRQMFVAVSNTSGISHPLAVYPLSFRFYYISWHIVLLVILVKMFVSKVGFSDQYWILLIKGCPEYDLCLPAYASYSRHEHLGFICGEQVI